jgi:hypothetical protein
VQRYQEEGEEKGMSAEAEQAGWKLVDRAAEALAEDKVVTVYLLGHEKPVGVTKASRVEGVAYFETATGVKHYAGYSSVLSVSSQDRPKPMQVSPGAAAAAGSAWG